MKITTPSLTPKVLEFCRSLNPGAEPIYVSCRPHELSRSRLCFINTLIQIHKAGGRPCFGWVIGQVGDLFLEASFHCLWKSPQKLLIDITYREFDEILFLPDDSLLPNQKPIPSKHFPLTNDPRVLMLISWLEAYEQAMLSVLEQYLQRLDESSVFLDEQLGKLKK